MVSHMENKALLISVIVCTYNRSSSLKGCLQSLKKQTANKSIYEVIVVDNNSSDNTEEIIKYFTKSRLTIRLVKEKNQGLSFARNRGWKDAKGIYVAYIDDDAIAESEWVEQIAHFLKTHPQVGVFGGPYDRFSPNPLPAWLPENYGTLNLGNKRKLLNTKDDWLSGSNIIFKKAILEQYSGFKTNLGMKGDKILYGEETELLIRLKKMEEAVYYVPNIRVKHLVAERKLSLWWLLKSDYFRNFSISLMNNDRLDLLRGLFYLIKSLFQLPFYLLMLTKDPWKRKLYFGLSNISGSLGRISGSMGNTN